jgi:hypothetical protein
MLELGPEYFRFTQSTYNKATSLVKIVGFFSGMFDIVMALYDADDELPHMIGRVDQRRIWICLSWRIYSTSTKSPKLTISKASVSQRLRLSECVNVAEQVEGRKVSKPAAPPAGTAEAKAAGSATLWDGDWLDSIARRPILLYPRKPSLCDREES